MDRHAIRKAYRIATPRRLARPFDRLKTGDRALPIEAIYDLLALSKVRKNAQLGVGW